MVNEIDRLRKEKSKAESKGQWKEAASLSNYIGVELCKVGQYEAALQCHTEEMELCTMLGDKLGIAVAHRKIGECYSEMCNFKKALHHQKLFLDLAVAVESTVEEQRAWATLGRTYYLKYLHACDENGSSEMKIKCLDKAEQSFLTGLDLAENIKNTLSDKEYAEMKGRLLLNLGLIHEQRGNLVLCAESIRKAIFLTRKYDLHEDLHRCQYSLACVYQRCEQYNFALRLLDEAIATADILKDKSQQCEDLSAKATVLIVLKDYESAKTYLKRAYRLHSPIAEDHEKIQKCLRIVVGLCICQCKLLKLNEADHESRRHLLEKMADGLAAFGSFRLATEYYLSTLECLKSVGAPESDRAAIYFSLAQTFADDGQHEKALEYFRKEFKCNEGVPEEQVKTLLKMSELMCQTKNYDDAEKFLVDALSVADSLKKDRLIFVCLKRLSEFYGDQMDMSKLEEIAKRLQGYEDNEPVSSDEASDNEESQNIFDDIRLSELSDGTDSEVENELSDRPRTKRRAKHPEAKKNELGETPLHRACISGNLKLVKQLIETGHPVNPRDNCGWLPLHEASNYGYYEIVEYLLENGAWINDHGGKLCEGITPLHDAAACGNTDVMKLLISKGASVTSVNNSGETPLDCLIKWWQRSEGELDGETVEQYKSMESELRKLMKQVGQSDISSQKGNVQSEEVVSVFSGEKQSSSVHRSDRLKEKRARSPSSSPVSEECDYINPHMDWETDEKWDDPHQAEKQYQTVMSNLRRSSMNEPVQKNALNSQPVCALLDQDKMVRDWLVDDFEERPQTSKRKRLKTSGKIRKISDYVVRNSGIQDENATESVINCVSPLDKDEQHSGIKDFSGRSVDSNLIASNTVTSFGAQRAPENIQSFCLRVRIADKVILVPVMDDSLLISWLAEEAAQRYHNLVGKKPRLLLMNKDGALLSGNDMVKTVLTNNEEISTSVISWDHRSLAESYEQLCSKRGVQPLPQLKAELGNLEQASTLCISNAYIPTGHLQFLVMSLQSYETLCHLDISSIEFGDDNFAELIHCFPKFTSLVTLNVSCCCLTSASLNCFAELLRKPEGVSMLPKLSSLNMSYNFFGGHSSDAFVPVLKLPSLQVFDLAACDLNYSFLNGPFCDALKAKITLQELNVSKNSLCKVGVEKLLNFLPKDGLHRLDFSHTSEIGVNIGESIFQYLSHSVHSSLSELIIQGCFLTDEDLKHLTECISNCPRLNLCDVSANPALNVNSLVDLVMAAHLNSIPLHSLYATGCCHWNTKTVGQFSSVLNLKLLRRVRLDSVPQSLVQVFFDQWSECWGRLAVCSNYLLCELKLQ